jgi:beta-N-acetylhexosaminidase
MRCVYRRSITSIDVRPYDPLRDDAGAFELWKRSLGRSWPVEAADFAAIVRDGFVAVRGGRVTGVAAVARDNSGGASLQLLLVDPDVRRRGIGTRLHDATLHQLARQGATRVQLAGTPGRYLWPGLPAELDQARAVFERWGWNFGYTCWDMLRSLDDYETPADVARGGSAFTYRPATDADREPLAAFEESCFPEWAVYFAADDALTSAIVAVDDRGAIVGSLLADDQRRPQLWRRLLGEDSGAIGAVGVIQTVRGRGVGTAMVAYACERLRERGVANCHIGWTTLLSFYGKLGFRPWRRYETAHYDL